MLIDMRLRFWNRIKEVGPVPLPTGSYSAMRLPKKVMVFWFWRVVAAGGIVVVLFLFSIIVLYRFEAGEPVLSVISRVLPLPAFRIDGEIVLYSNYKHYFDSWSSFKRVLGSNEELDDSEIREEVVSRLVKNVRLKRLAEEMGVEVTDDDFAALMDGFIKGFDNEVQFDGAVYNQFGWDRDAFFEYVVVPVVYIQKLSDSVYSWDVEQKSVKDMIEGVYLEVQADSSRMGELASGVSSSLSAGDGGELGIRSVGEYPEEARYMLLNVGLGNLTSIVELRNRFVFYQVLERDEKYDGVYVNAREISADKRDVFDVLDEHYDDDGDGGVYYYLPYLR